jgi:nicotinamide-nucleotide amidase
MDDARPSAARLGDLLRDRGETLAVAESCTGGLLGSTITGVSGSSDYFVGGIISYENRAKLQLLAVPQELLDEHGAVSRPVADEMARHVRDEAATDWGISTTGYAGAVDEGAEEPRGTVFIGIAHTGRVDGTGPWSTVEHHRFDGDRATVKERTVGRALTAVCEHIRDRTDADG